MADELLRKEKLGTASDADSKKLTVIQSSLEQKTLMYIHNRDINYFSRLIMEFLNSRKEVGILLYEDEEILEYYNDQYYYLNKKKNIYESFLQKPKFQQPYIYIPISYYILKFLDDDFIDNYMEGLDVLSEDELLVIKEIRGQNITDIRIEINKGKIKRIESDKKGHLTEAQTIELKKIFCLKNYHRITFETRDEKTVSFKHTKKIIK